MYHPGKVLKVFPPEGDGIISADSDTQAMLKMWDENLVTLAVDTHISKEVKEGDIVLVDYRPTNQNPPSPRMVVVKVLRDKIAGETWEDYSRHYESRKKGGKDTEEKPLSYHG